jgi:AraC family cel operon transcriptional repressor
MICFNYFDITERMKAMPLIDNQKPKTYTFDMFRTPDSPVHAAHTVFRKSTTDFHSHKDFCEFFLVRKGSVIHHLNGKAHMLTSQSVAFIFAGDSHSIENESSSSIITNIAFPASFLEELLNLVGLDFKRNSNVVYQLENMDHHLWNTLVSKVNLFFLPGESFPYSSRCMLLYSLLSTLLLEFSELKPVSDLIPPWLVKACKDMRKLENFTQGLAAFVRLSGKSQEHLTRQFKRYYHETPTEYINNLRLQEAEALLLNSSESVADICYKVGFNNMSYFSYLFKKKNGVSPQNYRNRNADFFMRN